ncbi:MAG: hypothetical protein JXQ27_04285 [Acidobacteria bacterium]|nr:hypothetical protein [Acidobacteriota bacterium]
MFCAIHRWLISRALDDGRRAQPAPTRRHVQRCAECRRFADALDRVHRRLASEHPVMTETAAPELARRIDRALPAHLPSAPSGVGRLQWLQAAAAALLLVAVFIAALSLPEPAPTPAAEFAQASPNDRPTLNRLSASGDLLLAVSRRAESPMHQEIQHLQKHAADTGRFIVDCLDLRLTP